MDAPLRTFLLVCLHRCTYGPVLHGRVSAWAVQAQQKAQNQIKEKLNLQMGSLQKQIELLFRTTISSCPRGSLLPKQWENEIYSLALWITCLSPLFSEGAGLSKQGRTVRWRGPTGSMASVCGASAPPLRGHIPGVCGSLVTLWAQVVSGYMFTHKHTFMLKVFHISFCFLVFFFFIA